MNTSLGKGAIILTSSKVITMMLSMLSAMFLSRFQTLKEYGTYSQLLLIANIFTTIFMLGLPNSINYFLSQAESEEEKEQFVSTYYTFSTILSFLTGLILVAATPLFVSYFNNELIVDLWYFLAVYPWTRIILSSIENILIVYNKISRLIYFRILNSVFLFSIVMLVRILDLSFKEYMIIFIAVEVSFALSVYVIAKKIVRRFRFYLKKEQLRNILVFSVPLGLASVVGTLSIEFDKLLIGKFFNTEQLAIYTNAAREMPITIIATSLTAVLMPRLVRLLKVNKNKEAIKLWGEATTMSYIFICYFATCLFIFAPEVISLLYSDKYLEGVTVFRVYTIVLLLRCTYFGIILNSIGKTKFIFYSSILSLGLNGLLSYFLYLMLGFIGPAVATFLSILLIQVAQLKATSKNIKVPFRLIFPWRALTIITFINLAMGIIFAMVKETVSIESFTGEIIESILLGLLWGSIYFVMMAKYLKQKWTVLNKA